MDLSEVEHMRIFKYIVVTFIIVVCLIIGTSHFIPNHMECILTGFVGGFTIGTVSMLMYKIRGN